MDWQVSTPEQKATVIRPLIDDGQSFADVAKKLGVSKKSVVGLCNRHGIKAQKSSDGVNKFDHAAIAEYYKTHTRQETADHFGCGKTVVAVSAREYGINKIEDVNERRMSAMGKAGLYRVAKHFKISLGECQRRLLAVLNEEEEIAKNLLDEDA